MRAYYRTKYPYRCYSAPGKSALIDEGTLVSKASNDKFNAGALVESGPYAGFVVFPLPEGVYAVSILQVFVEQVESPAD